MTEYLGKEHAVFFRWLTDGISTAISREEHFALHVGADVAKERWMKWQSEIEPALRGSAIVTIIANVEHLVGKRSDKSWDIPDSWYGKKEFNNLRIIRHCWAHAAGRILPNRRTELEQFFQDLSNGAYSDREGKQLQPYFKLENDKAILKGLERVRVLCTELLAEKGLVEKWWEKK